MGFSFHAGSEKRRSRRAGVIADLPAATLPSSPASAPAWRATVPGRRPSSNAQRKVLALGRNLRTVPRAASGRSRSSEAADSAPGSAPSPFAGSVAGPAALAGSVAGPAALAGSVAGPAAFAVTWVDADSPAGCSVFAVPPVDVVAATVITSFLLVHTVVVAIF